MALGDTRLFQFKSKAARDKEQFEYERWAFPRGKEQRGKLEALMRELNPKGRIEFMMVGFLTCKELYDRYLEQYGSSERALAYIINEEKDYTQIVDRNELTKTLALVLADCELGESNEYPSADEIRARAGELDNLRRKRR